jgi:hypothetical protein
MLSLIKAEDTKNQTEDEMKEKEAPKTETFKVDSRNDSSASEIIASRFGKYRVGFFILNNLKEGERR